MTNDASFYEQALREADERSAIPALWAKAFADADGDFNRAKARYINLRVADLRLSEQESSRPNNEPASARAPGLVPGKTGSHHDDSVLAWPRLWARQIDFAICWAVTVGLAVLMGATLLPPTTNIFLQLAAGSLISALVLIGYETLSLAAFGTTLGKAALGLRVETRSGAPIEFERALRRSLGVWWLGCYAYLLFPILTVGAWLRSYRCLWKTGSTPWDDSCVTRVAGGPVPLWRATLAGVIAITAFTIVFGFEAIGRKEISREVQESILRSHGPSPTPAGTAAPSNPFSDPNFRSTPTNVAPSMPDVCGGFFASTSPGCPQYATREAAIRAKEASDQIDPDPGDALAQFNLGVMYEKGQGVPQDYAQAMKWYRKAADQGNAHAQHNLGNMYAEGRGAPPDYAQAVKWDRKAASQGVAESQNNVGVMYEKGQGVPKDYVEAMKWYRKAADQGNAYAQFNLGNMYLEGRGLPQDYVQAYTLFNLAALRFGTPEAKLIAEAVKNRDNVATQMTPAQIAEATILAREWKPK